MLVTFHGAARQVTGSMFLLETATGYKILIDCGADFNDRMNRKPLLDFPFEPSELDLVLLTHAHIDHSGNIPQLIRAGYSGQILCSSPTADLCALLLKDNQLLRASKKDKEFAVAMVNRALDRFVAVKASHDFKVNDEVTIRFIPTGHLLGACNILITVKEEETKTILFSGDVGRKNYPLLMDPEKSPVSPDYLVCESTYGARLHQEKNAPEDILERIIAETCVVHKGRLIIPAFSIGRTQTLIYTLRRMQLQGRIPNIRIFTDSPMSMNGSYVYEKHVNWLDKEAQQMYKTGGTLFDFDNMVYIKTYKETKMVSHFYEPCIIISSSGMIAGGRINEHVRHNLNNPFCTILMIGYSAEGTVGNELMQGKKMITMKKRDIPVEARILYTDMFSGHTDQQGLMEFVGQFDKQKLQKIFLVHGEEESMEAFKDKLSSEGYCDIVMPEKDEEFEL
ncbi:MAG: ysh1 [Chitinophagaceae bacterium]|nr:ysh1 [Chitinophagaceae bacterium]